MVSRRVKIFCREAVIPRSRMMVHNLLDGELALAHYAMGEIYVERGWG